MPDNRGFTPHHSFKDLPEAEYAEYAAMGIIDFQWLRDDYKALLITCDKVQIKCWVTDEGCLAVTFSTEGEPPSGGTK